MDLKCMKQLRKVLTFHSILRVWWAILGNRSNLPKKDCKEKSCSEFKRFFLAWMAPERCLKTLANSFCRNSITKQIQSSMCWTSIQKSLETLRQVFCEVFYSCCWFMRRFISQWNLIAADSLDLRLESHERRHPLGSRFFYERETAVVIFKLVCQGSNRPSNRCKTCENSTSASLFPQVTQYILSCRSPCPVTIGIGECFWSMRWLSFSHRTTQFRAGLSEHKRERTEKKWAGENRAKF